MTNDNLHIWNYAGKTDPKYTKKRTDGAKLTSINPTYQTEKATELWGPYGSAWGVKLKSIEFVEYTKPATKYSAEIPGMKKAIGYYDFYYPGSGYIPLAVDWLVHDDDFIIKMETKAISKSLARLGFNNDVFKGQFDDESYLMERMDASIERSQVDQAKKQQHKNHVNAMKTKLKALSDQIKDEKEKKNAKSMLAKAFADGHLSFENFNEEKVNGMIKTMESIIESEEIETVQSKADEVMENKKRIAKEIIKKGEKK